MEEKDKLKENARQARDPTEYLYGEKQNILNAKTISNVILSSFFLGIRQSPALLPEALC